MSFPVVYDPGWRANGPQPGAVALRDWARARYPFLTDLGVYNPRKIGNTNRWSVHAAGRAWDAGTPGRASKLDGQILADLLVKHHQELGIQMVIWDRRIWSNIRRGEGWRPYSGADPHTGHLHIELTSLAGQGLTLSKINQAVGGASMVQLPANRDATIRRIQAALGVEVDGDPFTKTAEAAENLSGSIKGLHAGNELLLVQIADIQAAADRLGAEVDRLRDEGNGWASFVEAVRQAALNG